MSGFGYNVLGFGANASSAAGGASDDEFNRVSFLSHFDGANNGVNNAFDDGSDSNHTITANGNVTQGSFGPFARPDGEWGVSFDGASDYLDANDGPTFGTGAFTIEFFVNHRAITGNHIMFDSRPTSTNGLYPMIWINSSGTLQYYVSTSSVISGGTMTINTWHHVAVSRTSTSTKMFLDGTQVGSTYSDSNNYVDSGRMRLGTSAFQVSDGFHVDGVISNVRVVNSALYTSNFTAPTGKLTAVTNTKLLTCQSNRFVDNSADGLTMTPSGDAAVSAFGPFLTSAVYDPAVNGASGYFDYSASNYLSAADSADWDFGSDNYTVEFWMYVTSSGVYQGIFNHWADFSGNDIAWSFEINTSNRLAFLFKTSGITVVTISSSTGDYLNQWVHVAAVRNSDVHAVYLNGVSKATSTNSGTINNCTDVLRVGAYQADYGFDGYICDARIVKGTAVYTGNFTPPTAPLTAITNTKLLLNMADGQAIDSAAQNNLTLVGTAKTSTAQYKFGTASLLLDGNSDLVTLPADVGRLSAGNAPIDFTIELAFRLAANVGVTPNSIIARWETSGNQRSWMVRMDNVSSENKMSFFDSSTGSNNASTTFSTAFSSETWYQIALVSASGAVKLYVNGTADSTTHTWTTGTFNAPYDSTALLSIGANVPSSPDNFFNGNIDEVRLSKFARYTSNFTAPTAAFADKGQ